MHELAIIQAVVNQVDAIAVENNVRSIETVQLEVGENFCVVPRLIQTAYKQSIKGTRLEDSELILTIVDASAECKHCGTFFNPLQTDGICTGCQESDYTVLTGKEFNIKDITGYVDD